MARYLEKGTQRKWFRFDRFDLQPIRGPTGFMTTEDTGVHRGPDFLRALYVLGGLMFSFARALLQVLFQNQRIHAVRIVTRPGLDYAVAVALVKRQCGEVIDSRFQPYGARSVSA